VTVTVRFAALIAIIGAAALLLPVSVIVALWVVAAAAALLDAWTMRTAPAVHRVLPMLSRGVPSPLRIEVRRGPTVDRASQVTIRQPQPPDLAIVPTTGHGMRLDSFVTARRRGVHTMPNVAVRLVGPFGLGARIHLINDPATAQVHPDLHAAHRIALAARRGLLQSEGRNRGPLGLGTEFEAVREYRPDDDVRQINWLATARTGRAMSTVHRQEEDRDLLLVVDTGRLTAAPFRGDASGAATYETLAATTRLDALFDAVSALAFTADAVGDRVGLLAYDSEERARLSPKRRGGQGVVDAALRLEPRPVLSDHDLVSLRLPAVRRSIVVIATDLLDESNAVRLVESVARVNASHDVLILTAVEPAIESAARDDRTVLGDTARDLVADRDLLVGRLRAAGATVVAADPYRLATASAKAYLSRRSGAKPRRHTSSQ
jgi:uncharacterized protein (DUF58 family)